MKREQKQAAAFLGAGFTFKGIEFRRCSLRSMSILSRIGSKFPASTDYQSLTELAYVLSTDHKTILAQIESDTIDEAIDNFADQFSMVEGNELIAKLCTAIAEDNSTIVEVITEDTDEKK